MKNTDWKAMEINGKPPPIGHPLRAERDRRFVNWVEEQVRLKKVGVVVNGTPQQIADYNGSRI